MDLTEQIATLAAELERLVEQRDAAAPGSQDRRDLDDSIAWRDAAITRLEKRQKTYALLDALFEIEVAS